MSEPTPSLTEILASILEMPEDKITEKAVLSDLGMDSLKMVELVIALEKTYSFRFSEEQLISSNFETLKTIRNAVTTGSNRA